MDLSVFGASCLIMKRLTAGEQLDVLMTNNV